MGKGGRKSRVLARRRSRSFPVAAPVGRAPAKPRGTPGPVCGRVVDLRIWTALAFVPALGIDTLTVATGLGASRYGGGGRWRTALSFAACEALMPVVGAMLGAALGARAGRPAAWAGGALLVVLGLREAREGWSERHERPDASVAQAPPRDPPGGLGVLLAGSVAVSVDELGVGLGAGTSGVPLHLLAPVLAAQAVLLTLAGLALGGRLRRATGRYGELAAGLALCAVGLAVASGRL